jgi:group II intron reverse transcriptase/maturase
MKCRRNLVKKTEKEPEHPFENLYGLLCNEVWLRVAAHRTLQNSGSATAGIDGMTKANFLGDYDGYINRLKETLKAKTFEPTPVKRVYIPKPNSEKKRPLDIPILLDRIVQEALRMILDPIGEMGFSVHSYGFRPNRSTYDAMAYIGTRLTGNSGLSYQWVMEGDIASYFDTIPPRRLIKAVKKRVADRAIRDLLWKFLRAGVMYQDTMRETLTGTPQGGIVSPLLANIYLHELDRYMESKYLNLTEAQRRTRRKQGKGNALYVRYADDFVVLWNGTKADAHAIKQDIGEVLHTMGLTLSEAKTKVTPIPEGFDFLGYRIIRSRGMSGKMVPKVLIPEKAIKQFRLKVREILTPSSTEESIGWIIQRLNWLTRGWCEYYRCTSSPSWAFRKVEYELFWDFAHWLGQKYEIRHMSAIRQRFHKDKTLGTTAAKLIMPTEYKAKRLMAKTWHNPYTEKDAARKEKERIKRESLFSYDIIKHGENRIGAHDLRDEVILRDGPICAWCKKEFHPSEVQVDHIKARARCRNPEDADRMPNMQVLCTTHHRAKTKTDLKVLSRMR